MLSLTSEPQTTVLPVERLPGWAPRCWCAQIYCASALQCPAHPVFTCSDFWSSLQNWHFRFWGAGLQFRLVSAASSNLVAVLHPSFQTSSQTSQLPSPFPSLPFATDCQVPPFLSPFPGSHTLLHHGLCELAVITRSGDFLQQAMARST